MIYKETNTYSEIAYVHPILFCGLPTVELTYNANFQMVRENLGASPALANFSYLEIQKMTNAMKGALDCEPFSNEISLLY